MRRRMFLGKIHRCRITHADLDYEGSVTIDADLMDAAGILEHEEVQIWNVTRGTRLMTYALRGPRAGRSSSTGSRRSSRTAAHTFFFLGAARATHESLHEVAHRPCRAKARF